MLLLCWQVVFKKKPNLTASQKIETDFQEVLSVILNKFFPDPQQLPILNGIINI